jgi:Tfp pilus assembly protein PilN
MAAQPTATVNLLASDWFEASNLGRFLKWSLSTGRYVVVLTELVVIIAFLSRFWFDRQLTNLRELRVEKSAVVDSLEDVRLRFEQTKKTLSVARGAINNQYDPAGRLSLIQSLTPLGVEYQSIKVSSQSASLTGFAPGSAMFSSLLTLLQQEDAFQNVAVTRLVQSQERFPGFEFQMTLTAGELTGQATFPGVLPIDQLDQPIDETTPSAEPG